MAELRTDQGHRPLDCSGNPELSTFVGLSWNSRRKQYTAAVNCGDR